jgi:hypothetical protein
MLRGIVIALAVVCLAHGQDPSQWIRRELPFGRGVNLQEFGGPNKTVIVRRREMSTIQATVIDYTRTIPKSFINVNGYAETVFVNPKEYLNVPKENGVRVDNRVSEAYLVFQDEESGVRVYFHDSVGAQNKYTLLIEPASVPSSGPRVTRSVRTQSTLPEPAGDESPNPQPIDAPATRPGWSIIGGTLLYQGKEISKNVDAEAAKWKLSRDRFIEERVWIEKERVFGSNQRDEYARLRDQRLTRVSEQERVIIDQMVRTYSQSGTPPSSKK